MEVVSLKPKNTAIDPKEDIHRLSIQMIRRSRTDNKIHIFQQQSIAGYKVGRLLSNHKGGGVGIGRWHRWHNRGIDHAKASHPVYL